MLEHKPFYHQTMRRLVYSFGTLFNDISIERKNLLTNNIEQTIKVPLSYASKEFWYSRLRQTPNSGSETLDNKVAITLPRMGYVLKNYTYDSARATSSAGRMFTLAADDNTILRSVLAPSPWNFEFDLMIMTRNMDDMFNICEQILPFFRPSHTVTLTEVNGMEFLRDIPIILNSVQPEEIFDYGSAKTRKCVTNFSFTLKSYLYSPIGDVKIIRRTDIQFDELFKIAITPLLSNAFPNDAIEYETNIIEI